MHQYNKFGLDLLKRFLSNIFSLNQIKGKEPTIADRYVTRRACVNQGNSCQCAKWYNIEIRNCTTHLVYNLTSTSGCPERYCFGEQYSGIADVIIALYTCTLCSTLNSVLFIGTMRFTTVFGVIGQHDSKHAPLSNFRRQWNMSKRKKQQ